mgnify:CR=1 FL=1|tara:strand:+ start:150 stop:2117 length:1968 start_codon:yes stop_codon:yes gene_type:complete
MADEIKLDENVTIRDAFKITGREKQIGTIEKNLKKAGLSMDSPFSIFQNEQASIDLAEAVKGKQGTSGNSNFTTLGSVESDLKPIYRRKTGTPYPFEKIFGADGVLQQSPDLMKKYSLQFKQPRRTRSFKEVPKGEISLKSIAQGISEIPNADVRAAVAFQSLIPLRPGEVAQLTADDIDFATGRISDEYRRVNKIRNPVELPEVALSILKSQQVKNGDELFKGVTTSKMSTAVKKHVAPKFDEYQKAMGRKIIGASDIRKIVPSIIIGQLGYDKEAGAILGHTKYDDVLGELTATTRKHYASKIMDDVGSSPKIALMSLQNMYGEVLGLDSLNELAGEFDLDLPDLTSEGSPKLIVVPKEQDIASNVRIQGELSDEDLDLIEERKTARRAELGATAKVAEKKGLEAELESLKLRPQVLEEKRKNLAADVDFEIEKADLKKQKRQELKANQEKIDKDLSKEELNKSKEILKEKLGNTKLFGKFLGIGGLLYGTQFIKEDFTSAQAANIAAQEGGDDSFESRMRKGASDLLGPNVAAGVEAGAKFLDPGIQMAAELGPEAVKETFGTTDVADATLTGDPNRPFKTKEMINADQQIMQDKADQQQYRQQVSPQVDDELAIQKQMNLKKQSEGFGREAERKSQLSLDQQINELLAQRR